MTRSLWRSVQASERWEAFVHPCKDAGLDTHTPTLCRTHHHFPQVMAPGGWRESGSVASYMGPGGALFDLLAASVAGTEWSRWAPITSSHPSPPSQVRLMNIIDGNSEGLRLRFQGVMFEVNGSILCCFAWTSSGKTAMKMFFCFLHTCAHKSSAKSASHQCFRTKICEFPKSVGFISHIHLGNSLQRALGKGGGGKTWNVTVLTICVSHLSGPIRFVSANTGFLLVRGAWLAYGWLLCKLAF